jgi:prophage regulatory protein
MPPTPANTHLIVTSKPQFDPATVIIRISELSAITGYARPTIYKRLKDDPTFPKPVPLSDSKSRGAPVGWILAEAQAWVRTRIALREVA